MELPVPVRVLVDSCLQIFVHLKTVTNSDHLVFGFILPRYGRPMICYVVLKPNPCCQVTVLPVKL